jgi:hypothetical protein
MRRCLIGIGLVLLWAASVRAEDDVAIGDRVKIQTVRPRQTIVGTVREIVDRRLVLAEGAAVECSNIGAIHRSLGMRTRTRRGILLGALAGVGMSAFFVGACPAVVRCRMDPATGQLVDCFPESCGGHTALTTLAFALGGAGLGGVTGHGMKSERWSRVRVALSASTGGASRRPLPSLGISVSF